MNAFVKSLCIFDDKKINKNTIGEASSIFPSLPDFRVITQIFAQNYEKEKIKKRSIVFIPLITEDLKRKLFFKVEGIHLQGRDFFRFSIENVRLIRKMLQPVKEENCLLFTCDTDNQYTVSEIKLCRISPGHFKRIIIV